MATHPSIVMWWVSRRNWVDDHDILESEEARRTNLLYDWQPAISRGRPYRFNGKVHTWPEILAPSDLIGFIDPDLKIEHRRTLQEIREANVSRRHLCGGVSGGQQDWFVRIAEGVVGCTG